MKGIGPIAGDDATESISIESNSDVLRCLELVILLGLVRRGVTSRSHDKTSETDLAVDLLLALEVGLGSTLATEDNVLGDVNHQLRSGTEEFYAPSPPRSGALSRGQ